MDNLSHLGSHKTEYKTVSPSDEILECFLNKYPHRPYEVTHDCLEVTTLCPKTGQPDFCTIDITFVPDKLCVETKSLKLYLCAYRNEGIFMETFANRILEDLVSAMDPKEIRVVATFASRGGIRTKVAAIHYKD